MIKKLKNWYFFTIVALISIFILLILIVELYTTNKLEKTLFFSIFSMQALIVLAFLWYLMVSKIRQKTLIADSFEYYVEKIISHGGIGILVFDENENIVWVSNYLEDKGFEKFLGRNLTNLLTDLSTLMPGIKNHVIKHNGTIFHYEIFYKRNSILLKDVSAETRLASRFNEEKLVLGELEIDNYAQYQVDLGEEGAFKLQQIIINMLDEMKKVYQIIYRQYSNGKFLIISNKRSLKKLEQTNFILLEHIHKEGEKLKIRASISFGISQENLILSELEKNAQEALRQAQSRGGDQVVIISPNTVPKSYGASSEAMFSESKIKIRNFSNRLIDKLKSDEIDNVIIHGHINSDLDAIGAALGVMAVVKTHASKKPVNIANVQWDNTTKKALNRLYSQEELEKIFIPRSKTNKLSTNRTLIIVVDTSTHHLIEQFSTMSKIKENNVFIFDHHRTGEIHIKHRRENVYIDTTASSASEIITEIITFSVKKIALTTPVLNMLLSGIYLDTNRFSKSTSWRTFYAASKLEQLGADSKFALSVLKKSAIEDDLIKQILSNVKEVKKGYFITTYNHPVPDDIVAKAADEILSLSGRRAGFVIAQVPNTKEIKMSARSNGVNVQRIAEVVGGGGHFSAAAARTREDIEVFEKNIIQAIVTNEDNNS